jgi:chromate reductase
MMPDILTLVGSLRAASYNRALAHAARAAAPPGLRLRLAGLDGIPVFSEDLEADGLPKPVHALADGILAADALIIVTPEYNVSIPGGLKNALDWLSRDPREPLRGCPAAVAGATLGTGGTRQAQAAVRHVLHGLGAHCLPLPPLEITQARRNFDEAGQLTDPATRAQLGSYLTELANWLISSPLPTRHGPSTKKEPMLYTR